MSEGGDPRAGIEHGPGRYRLLAKQPLPRQLRPPPGDSHHHGRQIHRRGIDSVVEEALGIATQGTGGFFVSFDLDVLDAPFAPDVSAPATGGLTPYQAFEGRPPPRPPPGLPWPRYHGRGSPLDRENRTARLAAQLVLEFAAGAKGRELRAV